MKTIQTQIEINVSKEQIWDLLMDFDSYPDWNPFIRSIQGNPQVGEQFQAVIGMEGSTPMEFKPTVIKAEPGKEFRWLGKLFFKGLFDGEHFFTFEDIGNGKTWLIHGEHFRGILVQLLKLFIEKDTLKGINAMNAAIKLLFKTNS